MRHHKTLIVIAHRLSTVQHSDQIVVLEQGVVGSRECMHELLSAKGRTTGSSTCRSTAEHGGSCTAGIGSEGALASCLPACPNRPEPGPEATRQARLTPSFDALYFASASGVRWSGNHSGHDEEAPTVAAAGSFCYNQRPCRAVAV